MEQVNIKFLDRYIKDERAIFQGSILNERSYMNSFDNLTYFPIIFDNRYGTT